MIFCFDHLLEDVNGEGGGGGGGVETEIKLLLPFVVDLDGLPSVLGGISNPQSPQQISLESTGNSFVLQMLLFFYAKLQWQHIG